MAKYSKYKFQKKLLYFPIQNKKNILNYKNLSYIFTVYTTRGTIILLLKCNFVVASSILLTI